MNSTTTSGNQANCANTASTTAEMTSVAKEKLAVAANAAAGTAKDFGGYYVAEPAKDMLTLMKEYAKSKPDVAALWCFGLGVIVGWKLRP